ncbi:MAG: cobyrinate a,c-diamide synthase [Prochlorothrix sp.]|nr:cobyrinate a,c-diamide synthase [Prochlorothrix sp.]
MTLIIAGERSGVGKTTVTLALLSALCRGSQFRLGEAPPTVQSFKVGPDYIDPMFHHHVTGRPCRNLDPVLTSEDYVRSCFQYHSQNAAHVLVEGVMGLFDGVETPPSRYGTDSAWSAHQRRLKIPDYGSTAHIARLLNIPVVLVLDCSHLSGSIAAIVQGYRTFDPQIYLAGVVLNRVGSDRHLRLLSQALTGIQVPILGVLRRQTEITIPDRHLGLVPAGELSNLDQVLDRLTTLGETCFDWEKLRPLLTPQRLLSCPLPPSQAVLPPSPEAQPAIAVAQDQAFNFYYADNLDLLQRAGARLLSWSPLAGEPLPPGTQGLYLGGGFPELFAAQLAAQSKLLKSLKDLIEQGLPTYAECGGLIYLCRQLVDFEGRSHRMVGVIPGEVTMERRLTLGYRRAIALGQSSILGEGETVWGHEFHRSQLSWRLAAALECLEPQALGSGPTADRMTDRMTDRITNPTPAANLAASPPVTSAPDDRDLFQIQTLADLAQPDHAIVPSYPEGWRLPHLHASYVHLHWGARPELADRLVALCRQFPPLGSKGGSPIKSP